MFNLGLTLNYVCVCVCVCVLGMCSPRREREEWKNETMLKGSGNKRLLTV
jgi:hypothetical protein